MQDVPCPRATDLFLQVSASYYAVTVQKTLTCGQISGTANRYRETGNTLDELFNESSSP